MDERAEITVGHGPRRDLLSVAIVYPVAVSALLLVFAALSSKAWRAIGAAGLLEVFAFILVLTVWAQLATGTEQVLLTSVGITRRTRIFGTPKLVDHREVRWEWLEGIPRGRISLGFVTFRWHKPGGYLDWFQLPVTPAQARAILDHPFCPKKPIRPQTLRQLGLPESFGGPGIPK